MVRSKRFICNNVNEKVINVKLMRYDNWECTKLFDLQGGCLSLAEQIHLLQLTIDFELPKYLVTKAHISSHLSKSLFLISIGSNDFLINYIRPLSPTRALYPPQVFAFRLITSLSIQLQVSTQALHLFVWKLNLINNKI